MQGHHLVVIIWHSVGTAAVSSDAMRSEDSHQYFLPLFWKLHRQTQCKEEWKLIHYYVTWKYRQQAVLNITH